MSKDIWHTKKKKAKENKTIFAQHKSILRGIDYFIWEPQEFTDAIREDVIAWCYLDDLLVLDSKLERTRKALDIAVDALKDNLSQANFTQMLDASRFHCIRTKCESALAEITALEQEEQQ